MGAQWGRPIPLPRAGLYLTLAVQSGVTVKGRIVDDQHPDKPLAGVNIKIFTDLDVGTRSGAGDEIFDGRATTDAQGRFVIPHRFPNTLWMQIEPALWMKTKINSVWTQAQVQLPPPSSAAVIDLEMTALPHPEFHYTGRVTDSKGAPVPEAQIFATVSYQSDPPHERIPMEGTHTKADGTYDLVATSPWVFNIEADGVEGGRPLFRQIMSPGMSAMPPGRYDIPLPPPILPQPAAPLPK